jgi:glycosyltransferase involved in cell wall biosynthesis
VNTPAHIGVGIMPACQRLGIPCVVTTHDYWWVCPKGTLLQPGGEVCDGTPGWATCVRCLAGDHARGWVRRLARVPLASSPLLLAMYSARAAGRGMSPADMIRWTRRRPLLAGQLDAASSVIFPSKAIAQVIVPYLGHQRWGIIPNGLVKAWFENPRPPADGVKEPADLTIGFAGSLAPHKAPHLLLDAVRLLGWNSTRLRLAGPAPNEHYARRLHALSDGLNVEFVGRLPAEKMPAFLRTLDVLAMTSIWPENCPYAVLEAQAAGVPVVGSRAGGVVELIDDRHLLFEPGATKSLAAALEYVRRHPQASRSSRVPTAEEMTNAVVRVYKEAYDNQRDIENGG